jgi:hypothetical protein
LATAASARVTSVVGQQIVDQRIDRRLHLPPGAAGATEFHTLARLALLADDLAHAFELARHAGVRGHDLVDRVGNLAFEAGPITGQTNREITIPHRLKNSEQFGQLSVR